MCPHGQHTSCATMLLMMLHPQGARMLRLKLLRLDRGDTAFAVARSIDRSVGRYSYLDRALVSPPREEREALARYFGVSPGTLFRSAIRRAPRDAREGLRAQ